MLISSTLKLTVNQPTNLPRSHGLELSKLLHQKIGCSLGDEKIPSTSYSAIVGRYTPSGDFVTFVPGEIYQLSWSGLQLDSAKAIASLNLSPSLEFLGTKFEIVNREDEITSYEQLYTELVANEPEPVRRFDLKFTTPTAFAQGSTHLALPVVNLMFRSWLERWNHFAPVYLGSDELIAYLSQAVLLKHHKIQTRSHQLPRGYVNGFVGQVTLQIPYRTDSLLANVANLLIQYSHYAGTGIKTRLGMGQTNLKQDI